MATQSKRRNITFFGASGTMGFEAFKCLYIRRNELKITVLLLPTKKEKKLFKPYKNSDDVSIIWGDATNYADVKKAVAGADVVLSTMALISPAADKNPDLAKAINTDAVANILKAISEEPNGNERILFAYTGTVAETGDRLPPIHWGRVGDPINPSVHDFYAITKINGEKLVMESSIKHWVSLRMTYIMPTTYSKYLALFDPIMFHLPLESCMENISDRDAGYGLVQCIDVPQESSFWRKAYNMGGGSKMRMTAYEYLDRSMRQNGMSGIKEVSKKHWFATRNFHMQYYDDSELTNSYLNYCRDSYSDWESALNSNMPSFITFFIKLSSRSKFIRAIFNLAGKALFTYMAEHKASGTAYWAKHGNTEYIDVFFGSQDEYKAIGHWDDKPLQLLSDSDLPKIKLNHGYDETKLRLDKSDLDSAAEFRGGKCTAKNWDGDMYQTLSWECAFNHSFSLKPYTVLKAGHWCPVCGGPPWPSKEIAEKNPFFAQVFRAKFTENI